MVWSPVAPAPRTSRRGRGRSFPCELPRSLAERMYPASKKRRRTVPTATMAATDKGRPRSRHKPDGRFRMPLGRTVLITLIPYDRRPGGIYRIARSAIKCADEMSRCGRSSARQIGTRRRHVTIMDGCWAKRQRGSESFLVCVAVGLLTGVLVVVLVVLFGLPKGTGF